MPLPPAIQTYGIDAAEYLTGIDEMVDWTDHLAESIDAAVDACARLGADLGASAGEAASGLDAVTAAVDRIAGSFDTLTEAADAAGASVAAVADRAVESFDALAESANSAADVITGSADRIAEQLDRAADGAGSLFDRLEELVGAAEAATAAMDAAAGAADDLAVSLDRACAAADVEAASSRRAGEATLTMGSLLKTAFLGAAIAVGIGVEQAAKFQSVMLTLSTQAGVNRSALGGLSQGVLDLAGKVGFSPSSLATALYHVESSFASVGITGPKALSLLQTAAEGAAVGHADLTDVTNALDSTIVAGVPGITSYSQAMGVLNAIVGSGDMTMQNLADAMGSGVMAVAKNYGQSIYQVGAALAVLGDNNIRGAKAATDLRMAWQAVQAPLTTAKGVLASLGLTDSTLADTMEHHGLSAAIGQFIQHLKASHVPMSQWGQLETEIFGKRAGVGIGILTAQYSRLQSKFPDLSKGAKGFGSAWAATQQNFEQQLRQMVAGLGALVISFGTKLLPPLTKVVGEIAKFTVFLEKHGEIAAFAGAIVSVAVAFKAAEQAAALFKVASAFAADNWAMLAVMGVILLAAALYELYRHSKLVRDIVADVGHALERAFKVSAAAAEVAVKWLAGAWDDIARAAEQVPGRVSKVWGTITRGAATAGHAVSHAFSSGWDDVYRDTIGEVVRLFDRVKGAITGGFDGWWKTHGEALKEVWTDLWGAISEIFTATWGALEAVFQSVAGVIGAAWDAAVTVTRVAWSAVAGDVKAAWDIISAGVTIVFDLIAAYVKTGWDIAVALFRVALAEIELVVKTAWDIIAAVVKIFWASIEVDVKVAWDIISGIFSIALDLITGHWSQAWTDLQTMFVQVWNAIKSYFGTVLAAVLALVTQVIGNVRQFIETTWNAIWAVTRQIWNNIKEFFGQAWNAILALTHQLVNDLLSFLVQTWHDIYTGVVSAWGSIVTFFEGVPAKIITALGDVGHMLWHAGIEIIHGLIGGIESMAGQAADAVKSVASDAYHGALNFLGISSPSKLFYEIGAWITEGLANGITQTTAKAEAAARSLAAKVTAAYSSGQITGPQESELFGKIATALAAVSKSAATAAAAYEYDKLGASITARVGSGITETIPQALSAARQLMVAVGRELNEGKISAAQADQLELKIQEAITSRREKLVKTMQEIGLKMAAGLLSSIENAASRSQAKSAVDKLITFVQEAWSAGDISLGKATALTAWLTADNDRLQNLAAQRQKLAATIKAADTYAATTTSNTESWAGISNITSSMTSGGMVYSGNILAGMRTDLSTINHFSEAIKRLGKLGLSKNLLNQIIQMGPDQGLQVATALLDGPLSVIRSMNETQAAINSASSGLGMTAANLMYDSGTQAGKGFLSGLQAQQKNITKLMDQIAKSMVDTIEKDLKIHSPSLVATEHGEMYGKGLVLGLQHSIPWVEGASHSLAQAADGGLGHGGTGAGSGSTNITIKVEVNIPGGFVGNAEELARELEPALRSAFLQYDKHNGNNGLSLRF